MGPAFRRGRGPRRLQRSEEDPMATGTTDSLPRRAAPPDTRGSSSRPSVVTLAGGIAAIVLVLAGTAIVQAARAIEGPALTPTCVAEGLTHFTPAVGNALPTGIKGAEGVCNIVQALKSP